MVAFKDPAVSFLVIPSGATTGERVTIDGTTGLITVFGPASTGPDSDIIAEMGNGVGLEVFGDISTLELTPFQGTGSNQSDAAGLLLWLNADPTNKASFFIGDDGSLRIDSLSYTSTVTGDPTQATIILASPTGTKVAQMGFIDVTTGFAVGPVIFVREDDGEAVVSAPKNVFVQNGLGCSITLQNGLIQVNTVNTRIALEDSPEQILLNTATTEVLLQESSNAVILFANNSLTPAAAIAVNQGTNNQGAARVFNESWHALPLANSWVAAVATDQAPQYRWGNDNKVYVRGIMTGGASTNFATLPAGYRPLKVIELPGIRPASGATAGTVPAVDISTAGLMTLVGMTVSGQQVSLGELSFSLD